MALDSNVYLYASATPDEYGQSNITPELWAEDIYTRAYKESILSSLVSLGVVEQRNDILGRSGHKFTLPKMTLLSAGNLTEGTPTPVSPLEFDGVEVTTRERGLATQMSTRSIDVSVSSFEQTVVNAMGGAMAEFLSANLVDELASASTAAVYPVVSATRRTAATIEDGDGLTVEQLNEAETRIRVALNSNRAVAILIHPRQEKDLRDLSQFIDASEYGSAGVLLNGEVGRIFGMTVIVSNHVTSALEGTGSDVPTYKGYVLAQQACVYAPKRPQSFLMGPLDGANLDRAVTLHTWSDYGYQNFEEAAIVPIKSA